MSAAPPSAPAPSCGSPAPRRGAALTLLAWVPVLAFSGFIFLVSSYSRPIELPRQVPHADKILHLGAYGVWGLLCAVAVMRSWPRLGTRGFVTAVWVAGTLYGLSDEVHQMFVPGREADPFDLAADSLGALAGAAAFLLLLRLVRGARGGGGGGIRGD